MRTPGAVAEQLEPGSRRVVFHPGRQRELLGLAPRAHRPVAAVALPLQAPGDAAACSE